MRFWVSVSMALLFCAAVLRNRPAPTTDKHSRETRETNELTLAGLRPGRDDAAKAIRLYGKPAARRRITNRWLDYSRNRRSSLP